MCLDQPNLEAWAFKTLPTRAPGRTAEAGEMGLHELSLPHCSWRGQRSPSHFIFPSMRRGLFSTSSSRQDELAHQSKDQRMPVRIPILHYIVTHMSLAGVRLFRITHHIISPFQSLKTNLGWSSLFSTNTAEKKKSFTAHVQLRLHTLPCCWSARSSFKKQLSFWQPFCRKEPIKKEMTLTEGQYLRDQRERDALKRNNWEVSSPVAKGRPPALQSKLLHCPGFCSIIY